MMALLYIVISSILSVSATPAPSRSTLTLAKPFKRSQVNNRFLAPISSRILTNQPAPLNVHHNGPYLINHYIYCDNLDQHTLDQIKAGTLFSEKEIQLINNFHKDKFNSLTSGLSASLNHYGTPSRVSGGSHDLNTATFTKDKTIHILHLPKENPHDFDDIKLHLNLADAHNSPDIGKVDFQLNKNFGSFEVNLASIKPPQLDDSLLPTTSAIDEVIKPLIKGHISLNYPTKHNTNLDEITHLITDNQDTSEIIPDQSDGNKEILDTPHFENQPLDNDPEKSSYDSPDALDSYGHPVKDSQSNLFQISNPSFKPNLPHLVSNENPEFLKSGFQLANGAEEFYRREEYFNQLNEIYELNRKRRQDVRFNRDKVLDDKKDKNRHPNHRYE